MTKNTRAGFFAIKMVIALAVFCLAALPAFGQQGRAFNWRLALQKHRTGEMVAFSAPVQTHSGEQFRLIIEPDAAGFCYIIAESPGDEIGVVYAGPLRAGEIWYSPVMQISPPSGTDYLHIIVSRTEQSSLAQRINAIGRTPTVAQRRALMNEISRLRTEVSRFRETPEIPVLMGGASRGQAADRSQGVEYSGLETYIKTIRLEH